MITFPSEFVIERARDLEADFSDVPTDAAIMTILMQLGNDKWSASDWAYLRRVHPDIYAEQDALVEHRPKVT